MSAQGCGEVPCHPNDITPQWLTVRLKENGALLSGKVASLTTEVAEKWYVATTARVSVEYEGCDVEKPPRDFFIKLSGPDLRYEGLALKEFEFYRLPYPSDLPLVPCFDVSHDPESGFSSILLQDLSKTHSQTRWSLPPPLPLCEAAVAALAHIHAHWWGSAPIEGAPSSSAPGHYHAGIARHIERLLPNFFEFLGDRLTEHQRELMQIVCEKLPELVAKRHADTRNLTVVHGDAHLWNVMFANDPAVDSCFFFDWEEWHHDVGAFDLAYMIALHWYPDHRARYEKHLLEIYHRELQGRIATQYGWDDFWADYRLGHLQNFVIPVFQWDMEVSPGSWWPHLERLFAAYEDLECAELL